MAKTFVKAAKLRLVFLLVGSCLASASVAYAQYPLQYPSKSEVGKDGTTVLLEDYANPPLSSMTHGGAPSGEINFKGQLGRVNSLRSEPANAPLAASRFFVVDQSNTLYILDKATKKFTPYLKFADVFPKFESDTGNTAGFVSIGFDPGYAKNGKFYTVHTEKPSMEGSPTPTSAHLPTLKLDGYETTPAVNPPAGPVNLESVLIEWTDTNIRNDTFEGSARELLRVGFDRNHPMADLIFNPLVRTGQDDYGNLYVSVGDGASGETPGPAHTLPQQLDTFMGKILLTPPDINLHPQDKLGPNGRYRIPSTGSDPNPFVSIANARGEIYAYGLRNPPRVNWDIASKTLLVNDIGLHDWEKINIVT